MKQLKWVARCLAIMLALAVYIPLMPQAQAAGFAAIVTADAMRVYSDSALLNLAGTLPKGEVVIVSGYQGPVASITYKERTGYASVQDMARVSDTCKKATININGALVYASQSLSAEHATLNRGTTVYYVDASGQWARIAAGSHVGYTNINWLDIESDGTDAISSKIPAVVAADSVEVYASPSSEGQVLGTLKKGVEINVLDYTKTWAHIEKNGYVGYCPVSALQKVEPAVTPAPTVAPANTSTTIVTPVTVTAVSASVYATASATGKLLGRLKKGQQVNLVSSSGVWAQIEKNGKYGFCLLSALTKTVETLPTIPPTMQIKFTATVVSGSSYVYAKKQADTAIARLNLGADVNVYAYDATWALISSGDARGFVEINKLNADSYSQLTSGSSGDSVLKLQKALEALGYFDGVPAGNYSSETTNAVKRFQAQMGFEADGVASQSVQRVLYSGSAAASPILSTTLAKGSSGTSVTRLQTRLLAKGYLSKSSSVDGDYGNITVSAVKLFQKAAGLTESGSADSATMKALWSSSAPALASGSTAADASSGSSSETSTGDKTAPNDAGDTPGANARIETVITAAKNQLGKPYVYGAMGMSSFDCSGLTSYAFKQVGITLQRTAYGQGYNDGVKITGLSNLVRGDIVCMNTIVDNDLSDHVGIYLGGGQMIHASSGAGRVIISSLTSGYYNRVFSWGRRIIQ